MRGLIAMAVRDGDMARAFAHAATAYRSRPRSPWLVDILADLYGRTGRWAEAQAVLAKTAAPTTKAASAARRDRSFRKLLALTPRVYPHASSRVRSSTRATARWCSVPSCSSRTRPDRLRAKRTGAWCRVDLGRASSA